MDLDKVVFPSSSSQLSHGFHKQHTLYITDCPTKLDDANVRLFFRIVDGDLCDPFDPCYYSIRPVRHLQMSMPSAFLSLPASLPTY